MADKKILIEAIQNSKMKKFVNYGKDSQENQENSLTNKEGEYDKMKEKEEINKKFKELRKKYTNLTVDDEAENYIQKLREIGEYNRWSLKLVQKWLTLFYHDKFWTNMSHSMLKYKYELNPENISLEVCNDFIDGYYIPSEKKIILCTNTLTNFEKPIKFQKAMKRHLILMYDHIRSSNYDFNDCSHLACSEIRATKLSGYCSTSFNYLSIYSNQEKNLEKNKSCVRNKASEFMATYYDHCLNKASSYINSVLEKCYYDDSPVKDLAREKDFMKFV